MEVTVGYYEVLEEILPADGDLDNRGYYGIIARGHAIGWKHTIKDRQYGDWVFINGLLTWYTIWDAVAMLHAQCAALEARLADNAD